MQLLRELKKRRATLWILAAPALLYYAWSCVPQVRDVLSPGWTTESSYSSWYVPAYLYCIIEWIVFGAWIYQLDEILRLVTNHTALLAHSRNRHLRFIPFVRVLASHLAAISEKYRIVTALIASAATLAAVTVLICLVMIYFLTRTPDGYPLLCLLIALRTSIYLSALLSMTHQALIRGRIIIAGIGLLPFLLLFQGLFSVDSAARFGTCACLMVLVLLPALILERRKRITIALFFRLRSPLLIGAVVLLILLLSTWNWYDQCSFPNVGERFETTQRTHCPPTELLSRKGSTWRSPVLLNIGGGGSRAAVFAALVVNRLWWMETPIESLCPLVKQKLLELQSPVREVVLENDSMVHLGRLLLINTRLISSVSGGSLASAYWTNATRNCVLSIPEPDRSDSLSLRVRALISFFSGSSSNARCVFSKSIGSMKFSDEMFDQIEANPFVEAMRQNYLAAAVVGLVNTTSSRAVIMRNAFHQYCFNPAGESFSNEIFTNAQRAHPCARLSDLFLLEADGTLPYSLFNATLTTTGERFAVTNLDERWLLPMQGLFGPDSPPEALNFVKDGERRFRASPGRVVVHHFVDPSWNPCLATAVWISADFPYGFPVNRMEYSGSGETRILGSLDGGIRNNVGVDSTMSLIRKLFNRTAEGTFEYRDRKFFMMDLDTSALWFDPSPANELTYHWGEADNARDRAREVGEQTAEVQYLNELRMLTGKACQPQPMIDFSDAKHPEGIKALIGFYASGWAWFRIRCGEVQNEYVSTSWHLSRADRRVLYQLAMSATMQEELELTASRYIELD